DDEPPADLVICQGVLQYLRASEAQQAMRALSRLTSGALYLEVLTREDWEHNCAQDRTDGDVSLRSSAWYRRHLQPRFIAIGGGIFRPKYTDAEHNEHELLGVRRGPGSDADEGQLSPALVLVRHGEGVIPAEAGVAVARAADGAVEAFEAEVAEAVCGHEARD